MSKIICKIKTVFEFMKGKIVELLKEKENANANNKG
jgi:hypothetical protein